MKYKVKIGAQHKICWTLKEVADYLTLLCGRGLINVSVKKYVEPKAKKKKK